MPDFVTLTEAASLLHCSVSTVRGRIRSGALPAQRLQDGRKLLIERADLARLLVPARANLAAPLAPGFTSLDVEGQAR